MGSSTNVQTSGYIPCYFFPYPCKHLLRLIIPLEKVIWLNNIYHELHRHHKVSLDILYYFLRSHCAEQDYFVGINEPCIASVVNRCIKKIHDLHTAWNIYVSNSNKFNQLEMD